MPSNTLTTRKFLVTLARPQDLHSKLIAVKYNFAVNDENCLRDKYEINSVQCVLVMVAIHLEIHVQI